MYFVLRVSLCCRTIVVLSGSELVSAKGSFLQRMFQCFLLLFPGGLIVLLITITEILMLGSPSLPVGESISAVGQWGILLAGAFTVFTSALQYYHKSHPSGGFDHDLDMYPNPIGGQPGAEETTDRRGVKHSSSLQRGGGSAGYLVRRSCAFPGAWSAEVD